MRILFFNPLANINLSSGVFKAFYVSMPPLWAGYLSSIAKKYTDEIEVIDNSVERLDVRGAFERIKEFSPDIVCISVLTQTANFSFKLSRAIKENLNSFVIMGGPHASYFAKEIVARGIADIVVVGEGEETFEEVLRNFELIKEIKKNFVEGDNVIDIPGAVLHTAQEIRERQRIKELDSIDFPAWEFFEKYMKYYKPPAPIKPSTVLTFLASRGCPYSCNFCMVQLGRKYVIRSPENICNEIELFYERYKVGHFFFCDPLFPPSKKVALKIFSYMEKRGIQKLTTWSTETRADVIDDEVADALKSSGCSVVALGIEGGDSEILRNINKSIKLEHVEKAVRALKKAGIRVMGLYMLGTPGETKKLSEKTIKFARKLKTCGAKFAITVPYPGTEIYEKYIKGKYTFKDDDWDYFSPYISSFPYSMEWTNIQPYELVKLQKKAYIYANLHIKNIFLFLIERRREIIQTFLNLLLKSKLANKAFLFFSKIKLTRFSLIRIMEKIKAS